jgi:hypothetical protein
MKAVNYTIVSYGLLFDVLRRISLIPENLRRDSCRIAKDFEKVFYVSIPYFVGNLVNTKCRIQEQLLGFLDTQIHKILGKWDHHALTKELREIGPADAEIF